MKVGYHAPPPGSHSGVADYAETLLRCTAALGSVEIGSRRADVHLYHLGNNSCMRKSTPMRSRQPGVIVLHDAVLHHFMLGALSHEEYIAEWIYNYGEWQRGLAKNCGATARGSASDPRYFEFPMLRRIAGTLARGHRA